MATVTITIRVNADRTWTIRVGRYVEHVSIHGKTHGQLWDHIKYAAITAGVVMCDDDLLALLDRARRES